ncbi:MAG: hypothetical protein R2737_11990 [Candidatus Nanopelagicales bacterium]
MRNSTARHGLVFALLAALMLLLVPATAHAAAYTAPPASFSSSGDQISGWYWLRSTGQSATWTFSKAAIAGHKRSSVHLNVSALVTNKASGGSGYSATAKFYVSSGRQTQTVVVYLRNPFRPIDPDFSNGVGYAAYGAASSPLKTALIADPESTITVTVAYPFPSKRHVAFQESSLFLGYRK